MAINFSRLKAQIKPFKPEVKKGYIFIATKEQSNNFVWTVASVGSKRKLLFTLVTLIHVDKDWAKEFKL